MIPVSIRVVSFVVVAVVIGRVLVTRQVQLDGIMVAKLSCCHVGVRRSAKEVGGISWKLRGKSFICGIVFQLH